MKYEEELDCTGRVVAFVGRNARRLLGTDSGKRVRRKGRSDDDNGQWVWAMRLDAGLFASWSLEYAGRKVTIRSSVFSVSHVRRRTRDVVQLHAGCRLALIDAISPSVQH